jgi:hypothetical protein
MVELEGNESENSNVSQNLKGDFTSIPAESQATESL